MNNKEKLHDKESNIRTPMGLYNWLGKNILPSEPVIIIDPKNEIKATPIKKG